MRLTDKRFWIVWAIAELLILSSCIYMSVHSKFIGVISVFGASQPLMTVLTLYKKKNRNRALTNLYKYCRSRCKWLGMGVLYDCLSNHTTYSPIVVLGYSKTCGNNSTKRTVVFTPSRYGENDGVIYLYGCCRMRENSIRATNQTFVFPNLSRQSNRPVFRISCASSRGYLQSRRA